MNSFISLAKKTVETYIGTGKIINPPASMPKEFNRKAGVFVSIHKVTPPVQFTQLHPQKLFDGYQPQTSREELRGCIGTFLPAQKNLALEIIHNSIRAATCDPRFFPIATGELPQLYYSVDILSCPEQVNETGDLNPKKYGLIVTAPEGQRGLLLPDLEGVKTVEQQIEICRAKAGISPEEKITLQRFTVKRHKEK